jgi:hypothetical protein
MKDEKGKGLGLLIGFGPKPKDDDKPESDEDDMGARRAAARAAMSALKDDDVEAFEEALASFVEYC